MNARKTITESLGVTTDWNCFQGLRQSVFNSTDGRINIGGIAVSAEDTNFAYSLVAETKGRKLTKAEYRDLRQFISGYIAGRN